MKRLKVKRDIEGQYVWAEYEYVRFMRLRAEQISILSLENECDDNISEVDSGRGR